MSVRNCGELGVSLQKIVTRLMANDNLVNLLYFEDKDPLNHLPLSSEEKREKIYEELIKIIPKVEAREDGKSVIAVYITRGAKLSGNREFVNVTFAVDVLVPMTQWIIKDTNLRPFAILGQIQESLEGKVINGLGKLEGGDFELALLTEEHSVYRQVYNLTEYV